MASAYPPVTLLVPNMHCPSCVDKITQLVEPLPGISDLHISLLHRTVAFRPNANGPSSSKANSGDKSTHRVISILRREGGFQVVTDWDESKSIISHAPEQPVSKWLNFFTTRQALERRREENRRKIHLDHCVVCREGREHDATPEASNGSGDKVIRTTLSIQGMTCVSCTRSITSALSVKLGVVSVDINLLGNSGVVRHRPEISAEQVREEVEDIGFDAEVISSADEASTLTYKTVLSIQGMTCVSCSSTIEAQLRGVEGVNQVDIDVLGNKGVVVHAGSLTSEQIKESIEDAGYDAEVVSSIRLDQQLETSERTIKVSVAGIFCGECIKKLNRHLESLPLKFTPFTLDNHTSDITYVPRDPFTVRDLLSGLTAVSPEFDAALVKAISLGDRSKRIQEHEVKVLAIHWLVAFVITIPTFTIAIAGMVLSPSSGGFKHLWMKPVWGSANLGTVVLWPLATIVQFGVGRIFYQRAFASWHPKSIFTSKHKITLRMFFNFGSMDLLVVLSTTVSYFASLAMLIIDVRSTGQESVGTYFDSCVFLIMFILLGRVLEAYAKSRTADAVSLLGQLRPESALLVNQEGKEHSTVYLSVDLLEIGDHVLVPPGSLPPTDGIIVGGSTTFDESSLTGESRPVKKGPGDEVYTGTTNLSGAITIRTTSLPGQTMLDKIMTAVGEASGRKAPIERLAERLTGIFVPIIVYLALVVLAVWLGITLAHDSPIHVDRPGGRIFFAIEFAIATLVVACPCGIGLAVPCANAVGTGLIAAKGALASGGGEAFIGATKVDTVVLDKTGTLTVGQSTVTDEAYWKDKEVVSPLVYAVETGSTHPLAKGIVEHLKPGDRTVGNTEEIAGRGVKATVDDTQLLIGNVALMTDHSVPLSSQQEETIHGWSEEAKSVVLVAIQVESGFKLACAYALSDPPRETTPAALASLRKMGKDIVMLTGDNAMTAIAVAKAIGIEPKNVIAGVGPEGKAQVIQELQGKGHIVMFVGDGINDTVALAAADVSVAMGHGSQATLASADFVLLSSTLATLPTLLHLSRKITMRQKLNLGWAILFNTVCLPLAAGVFYAAGGARLTPVWSAVVMACSSLSVVCSSLALRWGW